jgi:hypothetical protein
MKSDVTLPSQLNPIKKHNKNQPFSLPSSPTRSPYLSSDRLIIGQDGKPVMRRHLNNSKIDRKLSDELQRHLIFNNKNTQTPPLG